MTGETDIPTEAHVLIDDAEDGWINEHAWVAVSDEVPDAATAVKVVESLYPEEDRDEEEVYVCEGQQQWLRIDDPAAIGDPESEHWTPVDLTREEKGPFDKLFWVVSVVCPV